MSSDLSKQICICEFSRSTTQPCFFESLASPFPKQKSHTVNPLGLLWWKGFPNLSTQMKLLPLLTLNYTMLYFSVPLTCNTTKALFPPRNTSFKVHWFVRNVGDVSNQDRRPCKRQNLFSWYVTNFLFHVYNMI